MSYTIGSGIWSSVFAVPAAVVDEHIKMCSPLSLKILLLMLRHPEHPADIQWLSSRLCISAPDIADALNYWVGAGIVQLSDSPAMEQAADPPAQTNISSPAPGGPGPVPSVQTQAGENGQRIVTIAARPKIARDDVSEMAKNDDSIAQLLTLSQEILGAPLTPVESEILAALHSYYGLATDAVLMLLQYCVSTGHKSMHYVEKTAAAWLEKGISTYDQIEQEILRLTRNNDQEKKVIQAFGIYNRGLTSKERTYIEHLGHLSTLILGKRGKTVFRNRDRLGMEKHNAFAAGKICLIGRPDGSDIFFIIHVLHQFQRRAIYDSPFGGQSGYAL